MAIGKLTALTATRVKQPGMYGDGGGLYLQVSSSGARSWIFRYWTKDLGRSREMGLGSFHIVSLHRARELAGEYRKMREQGIDPIEVREKAKAKAKLEAAKSITFAECAELHQVASGRLAKRETRPAVAKYSRGLCLSGVRLIAGGGDQHHPGAQGDRADLAYQD